MFLISRLYKMIEELCAEASQFEIHRNSLFSMHVAHALAWCCYIITYLINRTGNQLLLEIISFKNFNTILLHSVRKIQNLIFILTRRTSG